MALFGLFKSKAERDQERRAEEAKLTRAHDLGRRTSETVTQLIDKFFDEKVSPVAIKVNKALVHDLETHHHDKTVDDAMDLVVDYQERLKNLKQAAIDGIWDSLGEWKYALINRRFHQSSVDGRRLRSARYQGQTFEGHLIFDLLWQFCL